MAVERAAGGTSLIDVLDRVLDKGIVIDAWVCVSLVGIDLITVEARVVVASIDTYLKYSEAVGAAATASRPALDVTARPYDELAAENAALRAQLEGPVVPVPRATTRRRRCAGEETDRRFSPGRPGRLSPWNHEPCAGQSYQPLARSGGQSRSAPRAARVLPRASR